MFEFTYNALILLFEAFGFYIFIPVLMLALIATVPVIIRTFIDYFRG